MAAKNTDFVWGGQQEFFLVGAEYRDDTLRIEANYSDQEQLLKLTLPTLCITYAEMNFANAIGGFQENYPASSNYGPQHFSPPVVIAGADEIEKLTWIRGGHRVVIGPDKTEIEWYPQENLVIPRLRLNSKELTAATLTVPQMSIAVDQQLIIDVIQYADGRQTGGIRIEKRHPQWKPPEVEAEHGLWIRVIDGETGEPLPEVTVNLFRWDPALASPLGTGGFDMVGQPSTDGQGIVYEANRPCDELEAVTLSLPGWRAVARCFRPLPGQQVRFHMSAWKLADDVAPYTWRVNDTLEDIALLTGSTPKKITQHNMLANAAALKAGMHISLPCYEARYTMEQGDTLEWLLETFAYASGEELAKVNGHAKPSELYDSPDIHLPGWHFFYARSGDSLVQIDEMFDLPPGWSRTVGRVHHPEPRLPYESETIAVPTKGFVQTHSEC